MNRKIAKPDDLAINHSYQDFSVLRPSETVQEALNKFRKSGLPHKIIYFYVADEQGRLLGVLPTRRLLISDSQTLVGDIFVKKAVSLPANTTIGEARRAFSRYKFLAFPIVDETNHLKGVIDIEKFAGDLGNIHERTSFDDIYQLLGVESTIESEKSSLVAFKMRFPWLISTIVSGGFAAILTTIFQTTIKESLILAFFLTMVLGLNESVCMQSATLSVQRLHKNENSSQKFLPLFFNELATSILLGLGCATLVAFIVFFWQQDGWSSLSIGLSLVLSIILSCLCGALTPFVLRKLNRDPKVAAAPIALGISDLVTLFLYFSIAKIFLDKTG